MKILADLKHETEKALLVVNADGEKVWVPKSQCDNIEYKDNAVTFEIPDWLADKNNLVGY